MKVTKIILNKLNFYPLKVFVIKTTEFMKQVFNVFYIFSWIIIKNATFAESIFTIQFFSRIVKKMFCKKLFLKKLNMRWIFEWQPQGFSFSIFSGRNISHKLTKNVLHCIAKLNEKSLIHTLKNLSLVVYVQSLYFPHNFWSKRIFSVVTDSELHREKFSYLVSLVLFILR